MTASSFSSWENRQSAGGNSSRRTFRRATGPPRSSSQNSKPNPITFVSHTCIAATSNGLPAWLPETNVEMSMPKAARFATMTRQIRTAATMRPTALPHHPSRVRDDQGGEQHQFDDRNDQSRDEQQGLRKQRVGDGGHHDRHGRRQAILTGRTTTVRQLLIERVAVVHARSVPDQDATGPCQGVARSATGCSARRWFTACSARQWFTACSPGSQ